MCCTRLVSGARVRIAAVSFVTLLVSSGVNLSFGLFVAPLGIEFGGSRAAVKAPGSSSIRSAASPAIPEPCSSTTFRRNLRSFGTFPGYP